MTKSWSRVEQQVALLHKDTPRLGEVVFHLLYKNQHRKSSKMKKQRTVFQLEEQDRKLIKKKLSDEENKLIVANRGGRMKYLKGIKRHKLLAIR